MLRLAPVKTYGSAAAPLQGGHAQVRTARALLVPARVAAAECAQLLGEDGVPKRIDSFAMAIQMGCTVYELEEVELSYAPPFGSAKDPVNFAGMVAADILRGDMPVCHWDSMDSGVLLDVRNGPELAVESLPGAVNIPLPELRARLGELPRDHEIHVFCRSGQRSYYATRVLLQNGFTARNIAGGMLTHSMRSEG